METGYAIDRMAAHQRQMRHAHLSLGALFDQREALYPLHVAGPGDSHLLQKAFVNFINNLEMPRQDVFQQRHGPFFERFREKRVIRIRHARSG